MAFRVTVNENCPNPLVQIRRKYYSNVIGAISSHFHYYPKLILFLMYEVDNLLYIFRKVNAALINATFCIYLYLKEIVIRIILKNY